MKRHSILTEASTVAVTGGLGFVGRNLVEALTTLGKRVIVADRAQPDAAPELHDAVELRRVDLRDRTQTHAALDGAEVIFHVAGNASGTLSIDRPRFDFETNAQVTFNVCEAIRSTPATRLVHVSSAMVYGRPRTVPIAESHPLQPYLPYAASKVAAEATVRAFVEAFGLSAVIARPFCIYGPGEDPRRAGCEVSQYLRWHVNGLPIQATGDIDRKTRDFVHVNDVVTGLLLLADRGEDGGAYNVGSGGEVSLRELGQTISRATEREVEILEDASVTDDTYRLVADVSGLCALGYQPRMSLQEGVGALLRQLGRDVELPQVDTIFRSGQREERDPVQERRLVELPA
jgi:UDP-glucose 4-epimerase